MSSMQKLWVYQYKENLPYYGEIYYVAYIDKYIAEKDALTRGVKCVSKKYRNVSKKVVRFFNENPDREMVKLSKKRIKWYKQDFTYNSECEWNKT